MTANIILLVLQVFVFLAVFLAVTSLGIWLTSGHKTLQRRLEKAAKTHEYRPEGEIQVGSFNVHWDEKAHKVVLPVAKWQESSLRKKLVYSGIRDESSINLLLSSKMVLAILLPTLLIIPMYVTGWISGHLPVAVIWMVTAAMLGYLLPDIYLAHRARERQRELKEVFPDVLDLLVVCVEAGLGLDAAIQRVSQEVGRSSRAMEDELMLVTLETRAGKARREALQGLSDRTRLNDVQSLVSILIQAENFGTSVGQALRGHSEEMRQVRIQRAKEKAAKLPVTLTFPIIFFIFPALFLVILGPALANIFSSLGGIFGG